VTALSSATIVTVTVGANDFRTPKRVMPCALTSAATTAHWRG